MSPDSPDNGALRDLLSAQSLEIGASPEDRGLEISCTHDHNVGNNQNSLQTEPARKNGEKINRQLTLSRICKKMRAF